MLNMVFHAPLKTMLNMVFHGKNGEIFSIMDY